MIEAALDLGFNSLGFSGHAPTAQATDWELSKAKIEAYKKEILMLSEEYSDRIKIYLGLELDRYSEGLYDPSGLAYTIGSAHMAKKDGVWYDFDHNYEEAKSTIDGLFGGDAISYARSYYETLIDTAYSLDFDIVGHFDLLTKFSEKHPELIPTDAKEYKSIALEALRAIREKRKYSRSTRALYRAATGQPPIPHLLYLTK